tara:strand:+ start:2661 stop:3266 length:606 start_codon:yes stop_codon:yes gene_type:complete
MTSNPRKSKSRGYKPNNICGLPLPKESKLPKEMKSIFVKCISKLGFVPNVFRAYALRPTKFEYFRSYNSELMAGDSGLSKLEREIIAVVVSSVNHCHYCIIAHGAAVRVLSKNPELGDTIAVNFRAANLNKRQKAMCHFAWKLTKEPHLVKEEDRKMLTKAGFSNEEIFDIVEVVGFYNMSNRLASGLSIKPNKEYYLLGR